MTMHHSGKRHPGWAPLIISICALALASCQTFFEPKTSVSFRPADSGVFTPRAQPAQLTSDSEQRLRARGFRKIGTLEVEHVIKIDDEPVTHTESTVDHMRRVAAKRGADLVRLTKKDAQRREKRFRNGSCLRTELVKKRVCTEDQWVTLACGPGWVHECVQYEQIPYWVEILHTEGTLWRRGP